MNKTRYSPKVRDGIRGHDVRIDEEGSASLRPMLEEPALTFEALYRTYFPSVYRRLYGLVGQHEQAEDLAQEVFLKVWRAWPPHSSERLSGWLATIANRTAYDAWRKQQIRPKPQSLETSLSWLEEVACPLDAAEAALAHLSFRSAWGSLSRRQQSLLVRKAAGVTLTELAQEEGCHRSTIMQRLVRGRVALRQRYEEADR